MQYAKSKSVFCVYQGSFQPSLQEQQKSHILQLWCLKDTLFFHSVYLSSTQQMSQESFSMSVIQMLGVVEDACERDTK